MKTGKTARVISLCPKCGSGEVAIEPTMHEAFDSTGPLIYWRCHTCKAIFSSRSLIGDPARPADERASGAH